MLPVNPAVATPQPTLAEPGYLKEILEQDGPIEEGVEVRPNQGGTLYHATIPLFHVINQRWNWVVPQNGFFKRNKMPTSNVQMMLNSAIMVCGACLQVELLEPSLDAVKEVMRLHAQTHRDNYWKHKNFQGEMIEMMPGENPRELCKACGRIHSAFSGYMRDHLRDSLAAGEKHLGKVEFFVTNEYAETAQPPKVFDRGVLLDAMPGFEVAPGDTQKHVGSSTGGSAGKRRRTRKRRRNRR